MNERKWDNIWRSKGIWIVHSFRQKKIIGSSWDPLAFRLNFNDSWLFLWLDKKKLLGLTEIHQRAAKICLYLLLILSLSTTDQASSLDSPIPYPCGLVSIRNIYPGSCFVRDKAITGNKPKTWLLTVIISFSRVFPNSYSLESCRSTG